MHLQDKFVLFCGVIDEAFFLLLHSIPLCVCVCVCMSITIYSIYGYLSDLQFGTILKNTVIDILLLIFKLHICVILSGHRECVSVSFSRHCSQLSTAAVLMYSPILADIWCFLFL